MNVVVPYFGALDRFRPLLDRWFASHRELGLAAALPVTLIGDDPDAEAAAVENGARFELVDVAGFLDLVRPGQPFDKKGAIVCSFLLRSSAPALVLDADAFLARDPRPTLEEFVDAPIAMPVDHGALVHDRTAKLEAPFEEVRKMCAGVQFFGFARGGRSRLVAGYRRAFEEIRALPKVPWAPPLSHLVEQYAWSVCWHRRGGKTLPASLNWAPSHLGPNPFAIVNHHYGHPKWRELGVRAPANS